MEPSGPTLPEFQNSSEPAAVRERIPTVRNDHRVAAVIPCYRVRTHILDVLATIGTEVQAIYVVDDACPEQSGKHVESHCDDPRVTVIYQPVNSGVGGATLAGFVRARSEGAEIVVKLDGDGQMDASRISALIRPLLEGLADYAKANRFFAPELLGDMPILRLLGNSALSFISKISSGYWRVMDPTNGFVAMHTKILGVLPIDKIDRTFFFESDLLFRLNTLRAVVAEVPMPARYGNEVSNLRVARAILPFAAKHLRCFIKRIFYNYFLRDFNLGSVQLVAGTFLTLFGAIFGGLAWWQHAQINQATPTGTVMIAALPILVGIQLLLSAVNYDILSEPRMPLHRQL
ncbi:MAG TPA: glycosyltransferase family 2 protein [Pirellulales bacterium]|nr:glycosyltransferase family 2 protein [Pirellulales bacterium]